MRAFRPTVAVTALLLTACVSAETSHLKAYPEVNDEIATPVLIVARVSPGKMLPEFDECKKPDVICLHSPLWFRAHILKSVYGTAPGSRLEVATTSHYGMMAYEHDTGPRLILLLVADGKVVMPTYSEMELTPRDDGKLFLVSSLGDNPYWLPCSVSSVEEEISPKHFSTLNGIRADDYKWKYVTEAPERFTIVQGVAFPRYGISISSLQAHLEQTKPNAKGFSCGQEDGV
jgi:hypothetical protein